MAKKNDIVKVKEMDSAMLVIPNIQELIHEISGVQVIFDVDIARIYGIEVRSLKQAVRRNLERFPSDFMFRVDKNIANSLIANKESQIVIPANQRFGGYDPYAFTEQGVAMLSSVLRSPVAIAINVQIMRAFVQIRRMVVENRAQTLEMKEIKARLALLEDAMENNLSVVNDLSEDLRAEVDNIYNAIGELSIKQKQLEHNPKTDLPEIGFEAKRYKK